jgi:hypothetical protein
MLPRKGVSLKIRSGPATPMTRMGFAPACKAVRRGVLGFGVAASEPGPRLGERIEWVVQLTISSYVNAFDESLNWNIFFEEGVLFAAGL